MVSDKNNGVLRIFSQASKNFSLGSVFNQLRTMLFLSTCRLVYCSACGQSLPVILKKNHRVVLLTTSEIFITRRDPYNQLKRERSVSNWSLPRKYPWSMTWLKRNYFSADPILLTLVNTVLHFAVIMRQKWNPTTFVSWGVV